MLSVFIYQNYKKKLVLAGGSFISLALLALLFVNPILGKDPKQACEVRIDKEIGTIKDTFAAAEFVVTTDEFEVETTSESPKKMVDSMTPVVNEPTKTSDEFAAPTGEFSQGSNEFVQVSGEFTSLDSTATTSEFGSLNGDSNTDQKKDYSLLYQLGVLFTLLILISFLIRYESFRKTKGLFLMASVVYLGFFKGACPCMISSFQNTILAILGSDIEWVSMVWFLGLIPLTFFFGKVWCGWLCHLGGLQEFLFQSPKLNILKLQKTQNILRYIRVGFLVVLIIQLLITRSNIFIHYDPFKVAFNLFSANLTGYILLIPLLISSVLIYRPFCRTVCPIGLILGWVALIPGARQLSKKDSCIDCISCSKSCQSKAMIYENKKSELQVQDCILCGDCMGSCKKHSLYVVNLKK
jgi:NAD-dependent dihydropyrimidine dehydrogenase PreA subunit